MLLVVDGQVFSVVLIGDASNAFMYSPLTSASATDPSTPLIIIASTYMVPLNYVPSLLPK